VDAVAFHKAFHSNEELKKLMGNKLSIEGYLDTIERIHDDISTRDAAILAQETMPQQGDLGPARPSFKESYAPEPAITTEEERPLAHASIAEVDGTSE
jgi:hypothetical protein